ncbi:hypothetical protein ACFQY0_08640 [Haloferula chungangensis]|uniref:Uncharacterized protein n=1 Tax=Haloferula chungangensis TaxID=1048331 RepID=A0ABW2L6R6_9BACT
MMNVFSGLKYTALFFALMLVSVSSQSFGADRIAKAVFIDPPKGAPEKVFLVAPEEDAVEVPLQSRAFSADLALPKGDLVLAILPRPLAEGEAVPKGAPTVRIPEGWSRCYLLFTVDTKNKVFPLKAIPIDGSLNNFPVGHSRIVNLSLAMVKGKFGEDIITIPPGKIENLKPQMKDIGAYPVMVDFMMKGDPKPQPLARTNWQHNPLSRQVVLITKPTGVKYPQFKVFQDRAPKPVEN